MTEEKTKIWSGRFTKSTESVMEAFGHSLHFDKKLFDYDIEVNKAWAQALVEIGIYSQEECEKVIDVLEHIRAEYYAGTLTFASSDEDIHSANERWLTEKLGELGARIHTGRSRNDQVVTDVRLYLREAIGELRQSLTELQTALIDLAEKHITTVFPGYTHVRQAQPISFAHYLLALFFQLQRDMERLGEAKCRINKLPLGSGALAGAAFPIDRQKLARRLGFDGATENSIDATADRDFITEILYICAQIMVHLSRVAEDLILWSSEAFGFVEIDQAYSTGSSMMPQKRNPDSLELIRGKSARVIGNQVKLLTLMKGLPTAYARDLQEDKEPLFDSFEQTHLSITVFKGVIETLHVNEEKMRTSLHPSLYATDIADYLVRKGVPFRQAHSIVGSLVTFAEENGLLLTELSFEQFRQFSHLFDRDVLGLFNPSNSLEKRNLPGGTGPESVKQQIDLARKLLAG